MSNTIAITAKTSRTKNVLAVNTNNVHQDKHEQENKNLSKQTAQEKAKRRTFPPNSLLRQKFQRWITKCRGKTIVSYNESLANMNQVQWSFFGPMFTLFVLCRLSECDLMKKIYGVLRGPSTSTSTPLLLSGPLAAHLALTFNLYTAPPAQPWNALGSQILCGITALLGQALFPHQTTLRIILVPSIAIALMKRLSITHPPAAGTAILFSMDKSLDWVNFLFFCVWGIAFRLPWER